MVGLLLSKDSATDCLFKLIFVQNLESSIRCDPEIEEEVDNRFKRRGIRATPSHRLEDVGIVPRPGSVRTVDAADVVGLILKEEPHRPIPGAHHDLPEILHGLRWGELVGDDHYGIRDMEEIFTNGGAAA